MVTGIDKNPQIQQNQVAPKPPSKEEEAAQHSAELESIPFPEEVNQEINNLKNQMHSQAPGPQNQNNSAQNKQNPSTENEQERSSNPSPPATAPEADRAADFNPMAMLGGMINPMDMMGMIMNPQEAIKNITGIDPKDLNSDKDKTQASKAISEDARKELLAQSALDSFIKGMPNAENSSPEKEQKIHKLLVKVLKMPQDKIKQFTDYLLKTPLLTAGLTTMKKNLQSFSNALANIKLDSINPINTSVEDYFRNVGKLIGPSLSLQSNADSVLGKLEDLTGSPWQNFKDNFKEKGLVGTAKHYWNKFFNAS